MAAFPGGTFNGFTFPPGVYIPGFGPPLNYPTRNAAGAVGGNLNFDAAKYLQQGACAGARAHRTRPRRRTPGGRTRSRCSRARSRGSRSAGRRRAIAANGSSPGSGSVRVRSDEPARVHRALPHPRPRRQRVHEALARDQVTAAEALVADDERREGATGGGSAAGRQSFIVGLRVLLLIAAAGAVVVAVTIAARGRGGDTAVRYACPMHPEVRGRGSRRMSDLPHGAGAHRVRAWCGEALPRGGGHRRPARDRQRQEAQRRRLRAAARAAARAARAARLRRGSTATARSPRSSTTIRSRRWRPTSRHPSDRATAPRAR